MHPILPAGSIVAIDRSMTDPLQLHGRIVAACPDGKPMIRWLEVSGRHMILRPNLQGREFPLVPVEIDDDRTSCIIGQVVWSWSRFSQRLIGHRRLILIDPYDRLPPRARRAPMRRRPGCRRAALTGPSCELSEPDGRRVGAAAACPRPTPAATGSGSDVRPCA